MRQNTKTVNKGVKNNFLTLEEILDTIKKLMPLLEKEYRIKSLGVFGSYAKGKQKKRSDIDILVEFEESPSLLKLVRLQNYISKALGTKVDIVLKKTLRPNIGRHILSEVV